MKKKILKQVQTRFRNFFELDWKEWFFKKTYDDLLIFEIARMQLTGIPAANDAWCDCKSTLITNSPSSTNKAFSTRLYVMSDG